MLSIVGQYVALRIIERDFFLSGELMELPSSIIDTNKNEVLNTKEARK